MSHDGSNQVARPDRITLRNNEYEWSRKMVSCFITNDAKGKIHIL